MYFSVLMPQITYVAMVLMEYAVLTRKRKISFHIILRLSVYILTIFMVLQLKKIMPENNYFYYLLNIPTVATSLYLFKERFSQKLFLLFMNWEILTFLSSAGNFLNPFSNLFQDVIALRTILYLIGAFILLFLYFGIMRDKIRSLFLYSSKQKPVYALFPFINFILFIFLFPPFISSLSSFELIKMVLLEICILISYYMMASNSRIAYNQLLSESRIKNTEKMISLQKKYYTKVEKGIYDQRKALHDYRHHLVVLSTLSQSGDYEALRNYIDKLLKNDPGNDLTRYCLNPVVNAVVGGYVKMAESKEISFSAELDLPDEIGIDEYDLCIIYGNLLENSIEACDRIPYRSRALRELYISVNTLVDRSNILIRIENSYQSSPLDKKNTFLSSKGSIGGLGLESVKNIVEKYDGCLSFERQEDLFIVSIVLCHELSLPQSNK